MQLLTPTEGAILNAARAIMLEIAERARNAQYLSENNEFNCGRINTYFELAEDAVFEALNGLSSYGDDKVAEQYAVYVGRSSEAQTSE